MHFQRASGKCISPDRGKKKKTRNGNTQNQEAEDLMQEKKDLMQEKKNQEKQNKVPGWQLCN